MGEQSGARRGARRGGLATEPAEGEARRRERRLDNDLTHLESRLYLKGVDGDAAEPRSQRPKGSVKCGLEPRGSDQLGRDPARLQYQSRNGRTAVGYF